MAFVNMTLQQLVPTSWLFPRRLAKHRGKHGLPGNVSTAPVYVVAHAERDPLLPSQMTLFLIALRIPSRHYLPYNRMPRFALLRLASSGCEILDREIKSDIVD